MANDPKSTLADGATPAASYAPILEAVGISKSFTDERGMQREVLADVSFPVHDGQVVCVLGPSGCGKSTLLRMLMGLVPPTSGALSYRGRPLSGLCPDSGVVFQNSALFPWMTVLENVRIGLNGRGLKPEDELSRVKRVLDLVGLEGYEHLAPRELSRGMKQRVSIARALVGRPEILFLDEPFAALDVLTAESIRSELYRLWRDRATGLRSILLITHKIEEAVFFADRIVILSQNPGRVRETVVNDVPHPREHRSPAFLAMVDRLHAILTGIHLPDYPAPGRQTSVTRLIPLPNVGISEIVGLLEILHDHGDQMELFDVNEYTNYEFGHTVSVIKAAELVGFVDTPGDMVRLNDEGRAFVAADINGRKARFRQRLLGLPTFLRVLTLLKNDEGHRVKADLVKDDLALIFPAEPPRPLFETIAYWGQWAELLEFDADADELALDRPALG